MSNGFTIRNALLFSILALAPNPAAAECAGPPSLEAKLGSHPDPQTYDALGSWFGDHRQFDCAAQAYQSGLRLAPDSARLSYLTGLSFYSAGKPELAVTPLQDSVRLAAQVLKAHLLLGAVLEQLQRHGAAKAEWQAALKIDPHSEIAIGALSKTLLAEGDYASAIALLRSAPRSEDAALSLALAYDKSKMLDQASAALKQALLTKPGSIRLNSALTTVLVKQTHIQDAVRLAEKCARLHPKNLDVQKLYLRVLVLNDDTKIALPLSHKLLALAPHDQDFLYLTGVLERGVGQYDAARDHLREAVALDPNYYNSRYNLGVVLAELKDPTGARDQLEKAIALGATEPEIRFKLANVLRTLGDTQAAQEQLKLYQQELKQRSDNTLAASKTAQADRALAAGDNARAVALCREATAAAPKDALLAYKLSLALDKTGDTVAEREALEQVIQIDPDFAIAHNQLGYLASQNGDSAAAEEHFRQAVHAAPTYTQAWISLAATLGMESKVPEAQEAIASALRIDPKNVQALDLSHALATQGAH